MATITSRTEAAIQLIENAEIVSAHIDASSHIILVKKDNSTIDGGSVVVGGTPPGAVIMFAGQSGQVPTGWLLCNGQEISRSTYGPLFTAIDTAYGAGNGTTTFNVPNFNVRLPRMELNHRGESGGSETHSHILPTHTHAGHAHDLDGGTPIGHAKINVQTGPGPNIQVDRVDVDTWSSVINADMSNAALTGGSPTRGANLAGKTNTAGGATTNTGGSPSDTKNNWPPYVNINFIIKT